LKKLLILTLLILFLVGCTQQATETATDGEQPAQQKAVKSDYAVKIEGNAFNPVALEVDVGESVKWTNNDAEPHSVSFQDETILDDRINQGENTVAIFNEAGTFSYKCKIHPSMTGTITVK